MPGAMLAERMALVRITDVAAAAGVSITTVSHALNGKGRIPEETRRRVRAAAEALGYRPSSAARSLGGRRTGLISISLSQDEGHCVGMSDFAYFLQLVNAATAAAIESGYALILSSDATHASPRLDQVPVDGGIVIDPIADDPHVARLEAAGAAVVTTGRVPGRADGHWVDNDHPRGLTRVLDHLAAQGAERVALVSIPLTTTYAVETEDTYRRWSAERGADPLVFCVSGGLTEAAGLAAAESLLGRAEPPDAICTPLDRLALGVLLGAGAMNVSVPDELLVATVTNSEATRVSTPPLTALELYPQQLGARAVEMLIDLIEGREPEESTVVVPTRLLKRGSSKPAGIFTGLVR
jgi:DNA-binding LacI/PurR family transcriptional regulator